MSGEEGKRILAVDDGISILRRVRESLMSLLKREVDTLKW